jgi:16S rRNA (cytidine1402-2'-O)-methyltransferase
VLFETGPRLAAALVDLAAGLGESREAAVCRELTKLHEEVRRGDLAALAAHYASAGAPRGEIVLVIAPPLQHAAEATDVDALLRRALERVSVKEAVGEIAAVTGRPRREIYQRALELTKAGHD